MSYFLNMGSWNSIFAVPTAVVDKYIKLASGNNLKVLLYFLRNASDEISMEELSKATGIKAGDAEDALMFWNEVGLFTVKEGELIPTEEKPTQKPVKSPSDEVIKLTSDVSQQSVKKIALERETRYYPKEIAQSVRGSKEVDFLFKFCTELFGRPLNHTEQNTLMIITEEIGIPVECTLMLLEYCSSINKATPSYIKKIALDWLERDIMTIEKVEAELKKMKDFSARENEFKKMFELNSAFSKEQKKMLEKWTTEYGFSIEMIDEAYQLTLNSAGKLSFPYMNKILEDWNSKGIKSKEQLQATQAKHKNEKQADRQLSFDVDEITRASMEKYGK